ncbi:MAG TPA: SagB/ThcOx family dehydrogenase [Bacteroidales bacterium]|nr:SagB/ThcOx family dehydrogenase [Bacteroidales bacterium]
MTKLLSLFILVALSAGISAQELKSIVLNSPDKTRGLPVMQALEKRASASEFSSEKLSLQDLSDLLWAADGINRPERKLRTAPSATNAQDIDIYVFMEEGIYLYNAGPHILDPVASGDHRKLVAERQPEMAKASVFLLLTSDIARFRNFPDSVKLSWAAMDAGIVSQNIAIFCASAGLSTRPRAVMDHAKLREILKLKDSQYLMLNNPVSYPVK